MSFEAYLTSVPEAGRSRLDEVIALIRAELTGADEVISYGIPTFKIGGRSVVHCAGYARHVSIHPIPEGDEAYREAVARYVKGKGTLQFQHRDPLPRDLIVQTVRLLRDR